MAIAVHPAPQLEEPSPDDGPGVAARRARRRGRGVGDRSPVGLSWGLILPSIIVVAIVSIFPIVYAINLSLHDTRYMEVGEFNDFAHFLQIFTTAEGLGQIARSFVYVIGSLLIAVPLSLGLANLLNQQVRGRRIFCGNGWSTPTTGPWASATSPSAGSTSWPTPSWRWSC